jgi:hypothetical protein
VKFPAAKKMPNVVGKGFESMKNSFCESEFGPFARSGIRAQVLINLTVSILSSLWAFEEDLLEAGCI